MKLHRSASIVLSIMLTLGVSHLNAGETSKQDREAFMAWASENQKSLVADDGVKIIHESIPKGFVEANVTDREIRNRNVIYYDPESGRFYFDEDTITSHADDRASVMTHRTYAELKPDKTVVVLGKKAVFHKSLLIKIAKGEVATDQPATAPESESKGNDKPQPESEAAPR